jgi:hypothetical protein
VITLRPLAATSRSGDCGQAVSFAEDAGLAEVLALPNVLAPSERQAVAVGPVAAAAASRVAALRLFIAVSSAPAEAKLDTRYPL